MFDPCDLERIGDCLWHCRRCGRRVHTVRRGDGSVVEPQPDRMPPCGWKPLAVEVGGHFWLEQPPDSQTHRRFRCQQCLQEVRLDAQLAEADLRQELARQAPCPNPRPTPSPNQPPAAQAPASPPGLLRQAANYAKAVGQWLAEGRPVRPPAEIERILSICKACEFYRDGRCRVCGCRVSADETAWRNKIAMASQRCPRGKW